MPAASFLLQFQEEVTENAEYRPTAGTYTGTKAREEADQDQTALLLGTATIAKGETGDRSSDGGYFSIPRSL